MMRVGIISVTTANNGTTKRAKLSFVLTNASMVLSLRIRAPVVGDTITFASGTTFTANDGRLYYTDSESIAFKIASNHTQIIWDQFSPDSEHLNSILTANKIIELSNVNQFLNMPKQITQFPQGTAAQLLECLLLIKSNQEKIVTNLAANWRDHANFVSQESQDDDPPSPQTWPTLGPRSYIDYHFPEEAQELLLAAVGDNPNQTSANSLNSIKGPLLAKVTPQSSSLDNDIAQIYGAGFQPVGGHGFYSSLWEQYIRPTDGYYITSPSVYSNSAWDSGYMLRTLPLYVGEEAAPPLNQWGAVNGLPRFNVVSHGYNQYTAYTPVIDWDNGWTFLQPNGRNGTPNVPFWLKGYMTFYMGTAEAGIRFTIHDCLVFAHQDYPLAIARLVDGQPKFTVLFAGSETRKNANYTDEEHCILSLPGTGFITWDPIAAAQS